MVSLLGIDYVKSRVKTEPSPHDLNKNSDYYTAVPSRWHDCHNLQSYIMSGQKWFIPAYPIVDEEYVELVCVYQMAMKAKHTFTLVEIGARWRPWGYRAASAIRRYNLQVQKVDLLFIEPHKESCEAIRKVAQVNEFKLPKFNVSVVSMFLSYAKCLVPLKASRTQTTVTCTRVEWTTETWEEMR